MASLRARNAGILKSQTKIVDNNARRACKKISKSVCFHRVVINNEVKLDATINEKKHKNDALDSFGKASVFAKIASKVLKVTNASLNARIIGLKTKIGILNVAEKVSKGIAGAWNNSSLKATLSRLKNFRQGIINGWNELKATTQATSENAPTR